MRLPVLLFRVFVISVVALPVYFIGYSDTQAAIIEESLERAGSNCCNLADPYFRVNVFSGIVAGGQMYVDVLANYSSSYSIGSDNRVQAIVRQTYGSKTVDSEFLSNGVIKRLGPFTIPTTYGVYKISINVSGSWGWGSDSGTRYENFDYIFEIGPAPAPTVTISASPAYVQNGGSSLISWQSKNASSCTASGDWSPSISTIGTRTVSNLTKDQYTYKITCTGAGGKAESSTSVYTLQSPPAGRFTVSALNMVLPIGGTRATTVFVGSQSSTIYGPVLYCKMQGYPTDGNLQYFYYSYDCSPNGDEVPSVAPPHGVECNKTDVPTCPYLLSDRIVELAAYYCGGSRPTHWDYYPTPGTPSNSIRCTYTTSESGPVTLSIDNIVNNSSGVDVFGKGFEEGIIYSGSGFTTKSVTPTGGTLLNLTAGTQVPVGVYTATLSGLDSSSHTRNSTFEITTCPPPPQIKGSVDVIKSTTNPGTFSAEIEWDEPRNPCDLFVQSYVIELYKDDGTGNYTLVQSVSKSVSTKAYTFTGIAP